MSFSSDVKTELCKLPIEKSCCALSELYGSLLLANRFDYDMIKIITESEDVKNRLVLLLKTAFSMEFDSITYGNTQKNVKIILTVTIKEKLKRIFEGFGYDYKPSASLHINSAVFEDDCCKFSFFRGAFYTGGSINDPHKKYHFEFVTRHFNMRGEMIAILHDLGFAPKSVVRKSNYVIYFKDSEVIEDMLASMGATLKTLELMTVKIEKDLNNRINRKVNCDTANLIKAVNASAKQIEAIKYIDKKVGVENIPLNIREIATLRLNYPDETLTQLSLRMKEPLGKSGVNHRMRSLMQYAEDLKEKDGQ